MIKNYLVVCYAILVKSEKWNLESVDNKNKPVVPEEYVIPVAEYLAKQV